MRTPLDREVDDGDFSNHIQPRSQRNKEIRSQRPGWYRHSNPMSFRPKGKIDDKRFSSYRQSVYKYFLKNLSESSIMGISKVASAKNCNLWILVLVFCMSGFGFQSFKFLKIYYGKPSLVQIRVENDGHAMFPAFTICSRNRFRKTVFCRYKPDKCELISRNNRSTANSVVGDAIYDLLVERKTNMIHELGHSSNIIQDCKFNGDPEVYQDECQKMLEHFYDPFYGNCYTIPPKNLKGEALEASSPTFWDIASDLTLLLDVETEEILEVQKPIGLLATVHDDSLWPDLGKDGQLIVPGHFYSFAVQKTTVNLLPPPYKTNCSHIYYLPWQKKFRRRLSSKRCTIGCSQHYQLKKCNFVTKILSSYYDVLPYDPKKVTEDDKICAEKEEERTQHYCRITCGLPCKVPYFEADVSSKELTTKEMSYLRMRSSNNRTLEENLKNLAIVKIYFSTLDHRSFEHTPTYDTMKLFSYLGSYSGVWLGFSLLTIYEMMDVLLSTCLFAYHKHQNAANNRKHLMVISKNQRKEKKKLLKLKHSITAWRFVQRASNVA